MTVVLMTATAAGGGSGAHGLEAAERLGEVGDRRQLRDGAAVAPPRHEIRGTGRRAGVRDHAPETGGRAVLADQLRERGEPA